MRMDHSRRGDQACIGELYIAGALYRANAMRFPIYRLELALTSNGENI